MLIIGRKHQESIQIGPDIKVMILHEPGRGVRVGIEAPRDILILRTEVLTKPAVSKTKPSVSNLPPSDSPASRFVSPKRLTTPLLLLPLLIPLLWCLTMNAPHRRDPPPRAPSEQSHEVSLEQLVELAKSGDQSAWTKLYDRTKSLINKAIARRAARLSSYTGVDSNALKSTADESFLYAVKLFDAAKGHAFSTILCRRLTWDLNRFDPGGAVRIKSCRGHLSDDQKNILKLVSLDAPQYPGCREPRKDSLPASEHSDPACQAEANELVETVKRIIDGLPARQRTILSGRLAGETLAEIAARAGVSESRISQQFREAVRTFAERMAFACPDLPPMDLAELDEITRRVKRVDFG